MKPINKFLLVIAVVFTLYSCKKDEQKSPADYPFSKENESVNKTKLEDAGHDMITEMKSMENSEANTVLEAFVNCTNTNDPFGTAMKSTPVFRTISAASNLSVAESSFSYLSKMMKADVSEDPNSFQEVYDEYKGIYTWNIANQVWVKTTSNEFKFLFPSTKTGTSNNASLVITYTGKTGLTPLDNYDGDLPATFNASVFVGTKKVFEIDFKASYNGDGMPTSVNYFIALYPYKYEISWTYSSSAVSLRYHLTNGSKNIIDCYGKAGGNFAKANLENPEDPTDVFYNGNAYFQVFNIKLAGNIDFKNLYAAEQRIEQKDLEELEAYTQLAAEINKYMDLDLVFADTEQKIASVQAYPILRTVEYYDGYEHYTEKEGDIEMKLIFSSTDDSPTTLETYFNVGFQGFINDLNSFIVELNNDYELSLEPVDYGK